MAMTRWDQRFFSTTRGRIVALLRRATRTVDELADVLGLTDNAVRAHLATLERDGLVQQSGLRRGSGKPAYAYDLTPEAERLFPKAYGPILGELLDVLAERLPPAELEELLRAVGRRLEAAVQVLGELGGLAELEERDNLYLVAGYSCPLGVVVPDHPEACRLAEALLSELVGQPVTERCERGEQPRCRFEVPRGTNAISARASSTTQPRLVEPGR